MMRVSLFLVVVVLTVMLLAQGKVENFFKKTGKLFIILNKKNRFIFIPVVRF